MEAKSKQQSRDIAMYRHDVIDSTDATEGFICDPKRPYIVIARNVQTGAVVTELGSFATMRGALGYIKRIGSVA